MDKKYTPQLKTTLLVHAIAMVGFAFIYIFIPVPWGNLTGCLSNQLPVVFRMFGTAIFGLALMSAMAYRQITWEGVKVVIQANLVLYILFPIMLLLGITLWGLPSIAWMYFVVMVGFGIAFTYFYLKA
jgi:hypothetical protein